MNSISISSIAPPPTPSGAIKAPKSKIFSAAQRALEHMLSYGIKTIEQIIPCTSMYGSALKDLQANYEKHGSRVLDVIDHSTALTCFRELFEKQLKQLNLYSSLAYDVFAKTLKCGGCQELAIVCSQEKEIAPYHRYNFYLQGPLWSDGQSNDHCLIVISEAPLTMPTSRVPFIDFIATCKNTVVIDPYLQQVISSQDIAHAEDFKKQLLSMQTTVIKSFITIKPVIDCDAKKIEGLSMLEAYLKTLEASAIEPPKTVASFVYEKRKELILSLLSTCFTDLTWKISKRNDIWTVGTEDRLTTIKEALIKKGILGTLSKVKDKDNYCLMFNFKNYSELKKIGIALSV